MTIEFIGNKKPEEKRTDVPYYQCQFCQRKFLSFQDLREHYIDCQARKEWISHAILKTETEAKVYKKTYLSDFGEGDE